MNRGVDKALTLGVLTVFLAGCQQPVAPVRIDAAGVQPRVDYSDLAAVLDRGVDKAGFLDMFFLRRLAGPLDAQVKLLAVTGPTASPALFPTADDRLAYWYNARAAWAIELAVLAHCPQMLSAERFEKRPFPLDGRQMTLEQIDAILAQDPDWRVAVAAPCARLHRAAMPHKPFSAANVRQAVAERFQRYLDEPVRFVLDVQNRQVICPAVLWQLRSRVTDEYDRTYRTEGAALLTALLPHASGSAERRLQNAIGYRPVLDAPGGPMACEKNYVDDP